MIVGTSVERHAVFSEEPLRKVYDQIASPKQDGKCGQLV